MENEDNAASSRDDSEETSSEANFSVSDELAKSLWQVPLSPDIAEDERLSDKGLRLYIMLLGYARAKTTCFPSRQTLAKAVHCTVRYVDKLKAALKEIGLLDWKHRVFRDGRVHNYYTLLKYKPIQGKRPSDRGNADPPTGEMQDASPENCRTPDRGSAVPRNNTNSKNTDRKDKKKEEEDAAKRSSSSSLNSSLLKKSVESALTVFSNRTIPSNKEVELLKDKKIQQEMVVIESEIGWSEIPLMWKMYDEERNIEDSDWKGAKTKSLLSFFHWHKGEFKDFVLDKVYFRKIKELPEWDKHYMCTENRECRGISDELSRYLDRIRPDLDEPDRVFARCFSFKEKYEALVPFLTEEKTCPYCKTNMRMCSLKCPSCRKDL